jgi:hypothetical protein
MSVLYKIKLLAVPDNEPIIRVSLIPTNDAEQILEPLNKSIYISAETMIEIADMESVSDQLDAYRLEILKGNSAYQAEWEMQRTRKTIPIPDVMLSMVGNEFPATTNEELEAIESQPVLTEEPLVTEQPFTEVVV